MKKLIAILLAAIAFSAVSAGCGGNNTSKNETSSTNSATSKNDTSSMMSDAESDMGSMISGAESKAESMMDDAQNNGRVRDGDGFIGNEGHEDNDNGMMDGMDDFGNGNLDNGATLSNDAIF